MSRAIPLTGPLFAAAALMLSSPTTHAADRAAYLSACEKDRGAEAKAMCTCVADKVDSAFKDKQLIFAYDSLAKPIGEFVEVESGLTEKEEDSVVDRTFEFMKACGMVK
jgi:hypothetical protein